MAPQQVIAGIWEVKYFAITFCTNDQTACCTNDQTAFCCMLCDALHWSYQPAWWQEYAWTWCCSHTLFYELANFTRMQSSVYTIKWESQGTCYSSGGNFCACVLLVV